MSNAIEIYAQAFRLQSEGRILEAEALYMDIVRKYPDSKEKEYAQIQLEHLRGTASETIVVPLQEREKPNALFLSIPALVLAVLSLVLSIILISLFIQQKRESAYQKSYFSALFASQTNNREAFLRNIDAFKRLQPKNPEGYRLALDFYIRNNDAVSAQRELKACPTMSPAEIKIYYDRIAKMKKPQK
jgi:hypothetical protein